MIFTMMAAHDTSTITVAMMGYYLARHPEWQERLREESRALGKPTIGYDDLEALPSMDLAFKETLRMNAPVGWWRARRSRTPRSTGATSQRQPADTLDLRNSAHGAVVEEP